MLFIGLLHLAFEIFLKTFNTINQLYILYKIYKRFNSSIRFLYINQEIWFHPQTNVKTKTRSRTKQIHRTGQEGGISLDQLDN